MDDIIEGFNKLIKIVKNIWNFLKSIIEGFSTLLESLETVGSNLNLYETLLPSVLYIIMSVCLGVLIVKVIAGR